MVIDSLCKFYDKLVRDGVPVSEFGWSMVKAPYIVHLNLDGSINRIEYTGKEETVLGNNGKPKKVERVLTVKAPQHTVRSVNIKPFFLCDTAEYTFGVGADSYDGKNPKEVDRAKKKFLAYKDLAHEILDSANSSAAEAVLNFFDTWNVDKVRDNEIVIQNEDIFTNVGNFLFAYDGVYAVEDKEIVDAYDRYLDVVGLSESTVVATDCVTGEVGRICRVHAKLLGIPSLAGSGAALCSSNSLKSPSTDFLGKGQGYGFPMTERTVFKYVTAIQWLAAHVGTHCYYDSRSNVTILFWSQTANEAQNEMMYKLISCNPGDDIKTNTQFIDYIRSVCQAKPVLGAPESEEVNPEYHIIGLDSRNDYVARICFEYTGPMEAFAEGVLRHYEECTCDKDFGFATPYRIMMSTYPPGTDKIRDDRLYESLFSAILNNTPYPHQILSLILKRIATESSSDPMKAIGNIRAGFLRSYLIRNKGEDVPVSLDTNRKSIPYLLGRFLSFGDSLQYAAMDKLGKTLSEQFMRGMQYYPQIQFPQIEAKLGYYLFKLRKFNPGLYTIYADAHRALLDNIPPDSIPRSFTPEESAEFILGFYHETAERYRRIAQAKAEKSENAETEKESA